MKIQFFSGNTGEYYSRRTGPVGYNVDDLRVIREAITREASSLSKQKKNIRAYIGRNFPFSGVKLHEEGGAGLEVFLPDRKEGADYEN